MWINAERSRIKHTIISTGNGIYSFYCRKRKHLQWQRWKKKVNSFASFLPFFVLPFLCWHSRCDIYSLSKWWVSTSFSCVDELDVTYVHIKTYRLYYVRETMFIAKNCYASFHFVNNQSTRSILHVTRILNNFSWVFFAEKAFVRLFNFRFWDSNIGDVTSLNVIQIFKKSSWKVCCDNSTFSMQKVPHDRNKRFVEKLLPFT